MLRKKRLGTNPKAETKEIVISSAYGCVSWVLKIISWFCESK